LSDYPADRRFASVLFIADTPHSHTLHNRPRPQDGPQQVTQDPADVPGVPPAPLAPWWRAPTGEGGS
jgi:hypothetical protein